MNCPAPLHGDGLSKVDMLERLVTSQVAHISCDFDRMYQEPRHVVELPPGAFRLHDGLLTAAEISLLTLTQLHLVAIVPNAFVRDDAWRAKSVFVENTQQVGMVHVIQAFLSAKVPQVFCALWPVAEEASQPVLVEVFKRMGSQGKHVDKALQAVIREQVSAQNELHPRKWAVFQHYGFSG